MVMITNSFELFFWLYEKNLLLASPRFWWPNYSTFEVVVGAILTQNTKWENVQTSLENLKNHFHAPIKLEHIASISVENLASLIAPSGFKNQKAPRLVKLAQNILQDYDTFANFQQNTTREWLLAQKGIGFESADGILCYGCGRDEMVVDSYTAKLLKSFGYEFESYEEIKEWLMVGVNENFDKIVTLYAQDVSIHELYCDFHGMVVEFSKQKNSK